jgi:hypothetical protein
MVTLFVLFFALLAKAMTALGTPSLKWKSSLGLQGGLGSGVNSANRTQILFSPDGSRLFLVQLYIQSPAQPSKVSARVSARKTSDGAEIWNWPAPDDINTYEIYSSLSDDGSTYFVTFPGSVGFSGIVALDALSGEKKWLTAYPSKLFSYGYASFPAQSATGDFCVRKDADHVDCLDASTSKLHFQFNVSCLDSDSSCGFDPSKTILIGYNSNSTSKYFTAYNTTQAGVMLWQVLTPSGTLVAAVVISVNAVFAVITNADANSAQLWSIDLKSGLPSTGFPVSLPSSEYLNTYDMSLVPSGDALFVSRYDEGRRLETGAKSYALLDAATGKERWASVMPFFTIPSYPLVNVFSPDGRKVYADTWCASFALSGSLPVTCTSGASVVIVALLNGEITALPGPVAARTYAQYTDASSGVTTVYSTTNGSDSRISGYDNDGSLAWSIEGAYPVAVYARTVYYLEGSSDLTVSLVAASLPSASTESSPISVAAIAGGVLGGAMLVALAGAAFVQRAALGSTIRAALARSAPVSEKTSLLVDHSRPRSFMDEAHRAAVFEPASVYQDKPQTVPTFSRSFSKTAAPPTGF